MKKPEVVLKVTADQIRIEGKEITFKEMFVILISAIDILLKLYAERGYDKNPMITMLFKELSLMQKGK